LLGIVIALGLLHAVRYVPSEPFFNNDETRHVMTGVYFHDLLQDLPVGRLKDYTISYYARYPALGILIWPPFFYAIEGLAMTVFGTSMGVAKGVVGLFAVVAVIYLYRLALRTHGQFVATLAGLLFGLSPLVFEYTEHVMLEVPTLACALASIFYFEGYLGSASRRDLFLAALSASLAALTRFDGAFLLPTFAILMVARGRLAMLRRKDVWIMAGLALLLVVPCYALTGAIFGQALLFAVTSGTSESSTGFMVLSNFAFYPKALPQQLGWFILSPALIGLALTLNSTYRERAWPYLALMAATYITFSPMAELEARHAIYWVPAFALFAANAVETVGSMMRRQVAVPALTILVVLGAGCTSCAKPAEYVTGYEEAAQFVIKRSGHPSACLFDSFLNGDFIYQVRRNDPERGLWVLRGDKVFYSVLSEPHGGYEELVQNEKEILDTIYKLDPEYLVVEDPQVFFQMALPNLVRTTIGKNPDIFKLENTIELKSNYVSFRGKRLLIYRNLRRNPNPRREVWLRMLHLNQDLHAPIPRE